MTAKSVSIPGTSMTCDGNDHVAEFCPNPSLTGSGDPSTTFYGNASGGGSWPADDSTILAVNYTLITDDPAAIWVAELLGSAGWSLTPTMIGQGTVRQIQPQGRSLFYATDYVRFHVKAATGKTATINAAIDFI